MKKYSILVLSLVLTAALLVGCGCTNQNMDNTSAPTVLPTNEEVWDTTAPTTRATTEATTMPTTTHTTPNETNDGNATIDRGNGALEDTATNNTEGAVEGRARGVMPNTK